MSTSGSSKGKLLSKKQISFLGGCLFVLGVLLIVFSLRRMEAKVAVNVAIGAGALWVGTWLSTLAKGMNERTDVTSGKTEERKQA